MQTVDVTEVSAIGIDEQDGTCRDAECHTVILWSGNDEDILDMALAPCATLIPGACLPLPQSELIASSPEPKITRGTRGRRQGCQICRKPGDYHHHILLITLSVETARAYSTRDTKRSSPGAGAHEGTLGCSKSTNLVYNTHSHPSRNPKNNPTTHHRPRPSSKRSSKKRSCSTTC